MDRQKLEKLFVKLIFHLSNRIQAEGDQITSELTLKQYFVLSSLYNGNNRSSSINEIALFMGYTRQATTKIINNLEKQGYVELNKSIEDRRIVLVQPTQKAHSFFSTHNDYLALFAEELFKDISDGEIESTYNTLLLIRNNIDDGN